MGIDNLLGFVKNATEQTHITKIGVPNSSAAVDASHWIYKALYACPEALYHRHQMHLVYNTLIGYIDNYVNPLKELNVELTFVFDGMRVPAKHFTHQDRSAKKEEARLMVKKFLASNNPTEARKHMLRCIDVKFDIIEQVIAYCKRKNIKFIVAPFEADAQLAFLESQDICKFVITEDTDLILYGCRRIIYKMDTAGNCVFYERSKLVRCLEPTHDRELDFDKFRRICILSGCDYLKNIPGIGLQKAKKFFQLTKQDNVRLLLPKLSTYLKAPHLKGKVTPEYVENFIKAEETFKHHIVYDPRSESLKPLEPYPRGKCSLDYPLAGKRFHRVMANSLVRGDLNLDKLSFEDLDSESDAEEEEDDDDNYELANDDETADAAFSATAPGNGNGHASAKATTTAGAGSVANSASAAGDEQKYSKIGAEIAPAAAAAAPASALNA